MEDLRDKKQIIDEEGDDESIKKQQTPSEFLYRIGVEIGAFYGILLFIVNKFKYFFYTLIILLILLLPKQIGSFLGNVSHTYYYEITKNFIKK